MQSELPDHKQQGVKLGSSNCSSKSSFVISVSAGWTMIFQDCQTQIIQTKIFESNKFHIPHYCWNGALDQTVCLTVKLVWKSKKMWNNEAIRFLCMMQENSKMYFTFTNSLKSSIEDVIET